MRSTPNVFISGMNARMKNENESIFLRCDDIHDIYDGCEHIKTVPDLGYDHVCPWSSGHLSPPPLMSHCQPRTYLHIVKCYPRHWTHETGNQCHQCQCNNNNIQKGEMWTLLPPIVTIVFVILTNLKERRGQRRTVTGSVSLPGLGLNCHRDCDQLQRESHNVSQ